MTTLKEKFDQLKSWLLRRKIIRDLKKQNRHAIEVERVMEQFATQQVLAGRSEGSVSQSRNVLVKHQQVIKIKEEFQDFLGRLN